MVVVKIQTSTDGHKEIAVSTLQELHQIPQTKDHWAYVDGNFKSIGDITKSDVEQASEIILTPALRGG